MQRSMSKMLVREDEVEQRAALEEEKARRERAKKLRCEASRKRYLRAEEEHAHVGERQGPGQALHGAARRLAGHRFPEIIGRAKMTSRGRLARSWGTSMKEEYGI